MRKILFNFILIICVTSHAAPKQHLLCANFVDVPTPYALKMLAEFHDQNIILNPNIKGKTTISLKQLPWDNIWQAILKSQQLGQESIQKVLYIAPLKNIIDAEKTQSETIQQSPLNTLFIRLNYANAKQLTTLFQSKKNGLLSSAGYIAMDSRTNSLIIRDHKSQLDTIQPFIKKLDAPVPQVLITALIVNIDTHYEQSLGLRFNLHGQHLSGLLAETSLAITNNAKHLSLDAELSALEQQGHAEILSKPKLFTANQETAIIESGKEIPYQESAGEGATKTTFKKAVLSLKVTPQITSNKKIILKLKLNQDKPSAKIVKGVPTIDTQQIETQILTNDGATIVLGGIYERNQRQNIERIPLIGRMPMIGSFFRHKAKSNTKRELLIFVTPKILNAQTIQLHHNLTTNSEQ